MSTDFPGHLGLGPTASKILTLCDARGVHDIPTGEWTVTAILAMQKCLPFFADQQRQGKWALGQASATRRPSIAYQDQESSAGDE